MRLQSRLQILPPDDYYCVILGRGDGFINLCIDVGEFAGRRFSVPDKCIIEDTPDGYRVKIWIDHTVSK